jgi:hypothetical protein
MSKSYHGNSDKVERTRRASVKQQKRQDHELRRERRAGHWLRTGVSQATVEWMRERDML